MVTTVLSHKLDQVDRSVLENTFDVLCSQAATSFFVSSADIRAMKKNPRVVEARDWVVEQLVNTVSYKDCIRREGNERIKVRYIQIGRFSVDPKGNGWHTISTTLIASLFGCDHSTIVLMRQRIRERARIAAADAQLAPSTE